MGAGEALLEDPRPVADEYRRRIGQANGESGPLEQVARLDRQIATVQRGINRLIDCYAGGFIEKAEFEPASRLKLRRSQLQEQQRATVKTANSERELSLVISRLEDFSAKVTHGLDGLDWLGVRAIIHTVVRKSRSIVTTSKSCSECLQREGLPEAGSIPPPGYFAGLYKRAGTKSREVRSVLAVPQAQLWGFERRARRVRWRARGEMLERLRRAKQGHG